MQIAAWVVSDAAGYYVGRYDTEAEADAHAADLEGSDVGPEWANGQVTFDRIPPNDPDPGEMDGDHASALASAYGPEE